MATVSTNTNPSETPTTTPVSANDNTSNPLKAYRSYSYHFILVVMDTTAYLDISNASTRNLVNQNPTPGNVASQVGNSSFYDRRDPVNNPRMIMQDANGLGNYSIFIDTRQDTDFIIEDVEWGTTFIGNSNTSDSPVGLNTFLTDGQMRIVEPRGAEFLNALAAYADPKQLNTDPATMPMMMKIVFVGHKDDGTSEIVPVNVPPFGIVFTDITGSIDANGTTYMIKYCGLLNGAAWNQTYDSIVDGMTFYFIPNLDLAGHLAAFQAAINAKYLTDRQEVIDNYAKATTPSVNLSKTAIIEWHLVLRTDGAEKLTKLNDFGILCPDQSKNEGIVMQYKGTKEGGIAELISKLMSSSKQWTDVQITGHENIKEADDITTRYAFKISTQFEKTSVKNGNKFILTYYIDEYSYSAVDVVDNQSGQGNAKPPTINPNNVYTFDYIFTGKNIDIQKLEMNLSLGYALWISLVTSRSMPTQTEDIVGSIGNAATIQTRPIQTNMDPRESIRLGTPIWPTVVAKETAKKELKSDAAVASADALWRNFASYQSIQTDLSILGNPNLIQKISSPSTTGPDYVKINVKMPSTTDDIWEYEQSNNLYPSGYYKTFWFDGYYNIITAKNRFMGGQFTQDLQLIGIPQVSSDMIANNALQSFQDQSAQTPQPVLSNQVATPQSQPDQSTLTGSNGEINQSNNFIQTTGTPTTQQASPSPTTFSLLDQTISEAMASAKTTIKS
jgi:hypothetical protein